MSARLFGPTPAKDAPKLAGLQWLRRVYVRMLPLNLAAYTVAALFGVSTIGWIALGATAIVWLQGWFSLSVRIQREKANEKADDSGMSASEAE